MANQPEEQVYDAGVYQIETTDPVLGGLGGIANAPLLNLANRTAWLKKRIDDIVAGLVDLTGYAKLLSPNFTGSPTAPTQPLGDNTTMLATDAFVQGTVGGYMTKSVAGGANVTLTAVEAGRGILRFTGALTANIAVIVPTSPTRSWIIINATSGAYTLTVKTAGGTGVVCSQGYKSLVYTDGTNVYDAFTDFKNAELTGTPTAPTAAQFDADTTVANTAFVQAALGNFAGYRLISAVATLTAADIGKAIRLSGTGYTVTLPLAADVVNGAALYLENTGSGVITVSRQSTDNITPDGTNITSFTMGIGDTAWLVRTGAGVWTLIGGSIQLPYAAAIIDMIDTAIDNAATPGSHNDITVTATNSTITAEIPYDDTVPEVTEGQQIMTLTYTPSKAGAKYIVEAMVNLTPHGAGVQAIAALFQGSTCIDASFCSAANDFTSYDEQSQIHLGGHNGVLTAPSTTPITFSVRVGTENAANPVEVNGTAASATRFGGIMKSYLRVREV